MIQIEQRLVDLAEQMQAAAAELAQGVADANEALAKSGANAELEQMVVDMTESLAKVLDSLKSGLSIAAPTVNVEVKVPEQPAPQVNVSPVIEIPQQAVEFKPVINLPAQPPVQVHVIKGGLAWESVYRYDERGRLIGARHVQVDSPKKS